MNERQLKEKIDVLNDQAIKLYVDFINENEKYRQDQQLEEMLFDYCHNTLGQDISFEEYLGQYVKKN
jgi:hemerythrin superfamily protein